MKILTFIVSAFLFLSFLPGIVIDASGEAEDTTIAAPLSSQTQMCIGCHSRYTPGIVMDWKTSRHAQNTPASGMKKPDLEKRISARDLPDALRNHAVGCYECHSLNPSGHRDNFGHMGQKINVVVTPNDCSTCHPVEFAQFSKSKMAYAYRNIMDNPVYRILIDTSAGLTVFEKNTLSTQKASDKTLHETCLGCHGTDVTLKGMKYISSALGPIEVPDLTNWPNQGIGRLNPDGSLGTCAACHARHGFSIEVARKPYTCSQCHHEPDVPAWEVYEESKHGNIYASKGKDWNFTNIPWRIGLDFMAPTCATCHNSLLISGDGSVIAERTHDFGSRLWVRLFGLIYSVPQPKSGDTTTIKNRDGLPLPATFTNEPASEFLIDKQEQEKRYQVMSKVCKGCHSTNWVNGHFEKMDNTIKETNEMTFTATKLLLDAWSKGIEDKSNPFDESIEKMWTKQWLFYSNSIRYSSAMTGAPDYTSFKNGWWNLNENLRLMKDAIELRGDENDRD